MLLFSYYYHHLPDLHSFPTRRSSDLGAGHRGGGPRVAGPWDRRVPAPGRVRSRLPGRGAAAARGGGAGHRSGGVVLGVGMRGKGKGEGGGGLEGSTVYVQLVVGWCGMGFGTGWDVTTSEA